MIHGNSVMLTLTVANCDNVVVNIKPIYLNKHVFSRISYSYKGKLLSFIVMKMFTESEIKKKSKL